MKKKLIIGNDSSDVITKELSSHFQKRPLDKGDDVLLAQKPAGLLLDFSKKYNQRKILSSVKNSLSAGIPVILLNINAKQMSKLIGYGVDSLCCIVRPYRETFIVHDLDSKVSKLEIGLTEQHCTQGQDGEKVCSKIKTDVIKNKVIDEINSFADLKANEQAEVKS